MVSSNNDPVPNQSQIDSFTHIILECESLIQAIYAVVPRYKEFIEGGFDIDKVNSLQVNLVRLKQKLDLVFPTIRGHRKNIGSLTCQSNQELRQSKPNISNLNCPMTVGLLKAGKNQVLTSFDPSTGVQGWDEI